MAKQETTCDDILKELRAKQYRPVYYLMGEESYYIDLISDYIVDNVLTDTEKEFNLTVVYGADVDIATVINAAKRYPMMSERQVVVVKEAQAIRNMEELSYYLQKPLNSTILVLCHKHGVLDRRKKLAAEIEKVGVLFESKKVKDAQLPAFITSYMKRKGVDLDPKATSMLADFVGTDLSRLTGELEKLIITLPKGIVLLDPEHNIQPAKKTNYQIQPTTKGLSQYDDLLNKLERIKSIVSDCSDKKCKLHSHISVIEELHDNIVYIGLDNDFYSTYQEILKKIPLQKILENGILVSMDNA